jgi:deazaflavin-dependent oxidoreductase (nitroreductase family)
MPLPAALARINKVATNRISARFAGRLPFFAIVHHTGRTSGKAYATPVMVFRRGADFIIVLTYGPETDWCKNVRAAGHCSLEYRKRRYDVDEPMVVDLSEVQENIPAVVRFIMNRIRVKYALTLRAALQVSA